MYEIQIKQMLHVCLENIVNKSFVVGYTTNLINQAIGEG